jgi:hypothetical protein
MSAAQMQLLTAKLSAKETAALKKLMLRPGFVEEWNSLNAQAAGFAKELLAKENATPSTCYKLFTSYDPEAVLWLGFTTKDPAVKERFHLFLKVWPETRQRIPYALMQEMRITPELPAYHEIARQLFLELIDGRLTAPEEIRSFLEPYSPPAPPPHVTIKRSRAKRSAESKVKERSYDDEEEPEEGPEEEEDLDDIGGDDEEIGLGMSIPKVDLEPEPADEGEPGEEETEPETPEPVSAQRSVRPPAEPKPAKEAALSVVAAAGQPEPKPAPKPAKVQKPHPAPKAKPEAIAKATGGAAAKSAAPSAKAKPVPVPKPVPAAAIKKASPSAVAKGAKTPKPAAAAKPVARKAPVKAPAKAPVKAPAQTPTKAAARTVEIGRAHV